MENISVDKLRVNEALGNRLRMDDTAGGRGLPTVVMVTERR